MYSISALVQIEERIHCKIISFTYDLLHTNQPQYLRKLIKINILVSLVLSIILLYAASLHLLLKN